MGVSWNTGTPKSSILMRLSLINYPFGVFPISGKLPMGFDKYDRLHEVGTPPVTHFGAQLEQPFGV